MFVTLLAMFSAMFGWAAPPAAAAAGDFSVDFIAAEPTTYDHGTGAGGVYGSRTIGTEVVESLEGGDFACGDIVVFFAAIEVDAGATEVHTTEFDFEFLAQSTGQDGVGFGEVLSATANTGDPGHVTNGDEAVTLLSQTGGHPGPANLEATVEITNLGAGDTQFILRLETLLDCTPGETPTGNLFAQLTAGRVTTPTVATINTGEQTIPFKQAGQVAFPDYTLTKVADPEGPVNAGDDIGFDITLTNTGNVPLTDVVVTDQLPAAASLTWTDDSPDCDVDGDDLLTCDYGDVEVGGERTVHVTATTTPGVCGQLDNTALATTGNAGDREAQASVTVLCPDIDIDKVASDGVDEDEDASDSETVNAGDTVGFDIVVTVGGEGTATDVEVTDTLPTLPSGGSWTIDPTVDGCSIVGQELSCSFPALDAGETVTIHVEAPTTAEDCATYENLAAVTTGNDGSDEDGAAVTVQCPNVRVEKVALDGVDEDEADSPAETVDAGTPTGFAITVTNDGPGTATNVTLSDTLPAGIAWAEDPDNPDCDIAGGVLTCDFGSLGEGESVTVTVTGMTAPENCGVLPNTATVDADGDTNAQDNSAGAEVTVQCPDLGVIKVADADQVDAGDQIGFTVTVSNAGPGTALDVELEDTLPTGSGVEWSIESQTAVPACTIVGQTLSCSPRDLPAGDSFSVHVVSDTAFASCAGYDNTAVASASNDDTVEASARTEVLCADLDIVKTADADSVSAGEQIGFTITATNNGDGTATGVSITDALPSGPGISWSESPDVPECEIATDPEGDQTLTCTPADGLAPPEWSLSVHVVSGTTEESCASYQNVAVIGATNHPEVDAQADTQVLCPGLNIAKSADAPSVSAGEQIGFTIEVDNTGPGTAFDVELEDELPGGDGIDWEIESTAGVDAGCDISDDDVVTCGPVDLDAGEGFSVHVVSGTAFVSCAVYDNTAVADASNDGEVMAEASTEVQCPDLQVVKVAGSDQVDAGMPIAFGIGVWNDGPGTAFDVELEDELPGGDGIEWQIVDVEGADCAIADDVLSCDPVDLGPGEGFGVIVQSDTAFVSCAVYDNTAVAVASNQDGEVTAEASTEVQCPDLSITKTADADSVDAGEDIGFTIEVVNAGPGAALGTVIVDELPTGTGIVWTEAPDTAECMVFQGTLTCDLGDLAAGASFSVHLTSPTTTEACATYENVATVSADNHEGLKAEASTDVECPDEEPPKGRLPLTGTDSGTLLTWGAILLALGAAGVAAARWRRSRAAG
jgi:uncharacterized repeat protein (TIGR01451 family)/LPXTG-motif cell wall-anchored protein